jgi:hypothetical protein
MRLRAHASTKPVRTLSRSQRRLAERATVDVSALSAADQEKPDARTAACSDARARGDSRRASSRYEATTLAEVLMKVLAHDVSRLLGTRMLSRSECSLCYVLIREPDRHARCRSAL